jgi:hypothetical protein
MAVDAHLAQLERKHKHLEQEIETERTHPNVDDVKLATLKRRKLKIKDEIVQLQRSKPPTVN